MVDIDVGLRKQMLPWWWTEARGRSRCAGRSRAWHDRASPRSCCAPSVSRCRPDLDENLDIFSSIRASSSNDIASQHRRHFLEPEVARTTLGRVDLADASYIHGRNSARHMFGSVDADCLVDGGWHPEILSTLGRRHRRRWSSTCTVRAAERLQKNLHPANGSCCRCP